MSILAEISTGIQQGRQAVVKELVQKAIDEGVGAKSILQDGLLDGMGIVGEKFKRNEMYVPNVLVAARAMSAGTELLKPYLIDAGVEPIGKAVIGTVLGDMHDIGKNLVKMMMEGKGIEVIDLGVNVSAEKFIEAAKAENAQIICCSALLTTTMNEIKTVVDACVEAGIRDEVTIMIGGAPVTDAFCKSINADIFTPDAASAADAAAQILSK